MWGKAAWANAWWYGAYRFTVLVVTCCSAVIKVNSDCEPYLSRSSSTPKGQSFRDEHHTHTRHDRTHAPERSPATNTRVKVQLRTTERWNTDAIHDYNYYYYYYESGISKNFLTFILIKSVKINVINCLEKFSKCKRTKTDLTFAKTKHLKMSHFTHCKHNTANFKPALKKKKSKE